MSGGGAPPGTGALHRGETYHHGGLREALLEGAEAILAERGVEGFSLREAARRAGVSPAAPAHHFGDAAGLLTAVAIAGFEGLAAALRAGNAEGGSDPRERLRRQGMGYVAYALAHPGRFRLMFRHERLRDDPRLRAAAGEAFGLLENALRGVAGLAPGAALDGPSLAGVIRVWSLVHGFAALALEGQFDRLAPGRDLAAFIAGILPEVLAPDPWTAGR